MKNPDSELEDDLRSEYDLKSLRVRRLGSERKSFGEYIVRLEPDVAELFPTADAVNEALLFLAGLAQASTEDLGAMVSDRPSVIEVTPLGYGLHWEALDVDLSVPSLLKGVYGTRAWMEQLHTVSR